MVERVSAMHLFNRSPFDRFRDRLSPAGAKRDSHDASTLDHALCTNRRFFRRLDPDKVEVIQLREWTRIADELTGERTRLVNRLRQQLWRYCPQLLKFANDLTMTRVPELRKPAPNPDKSRRLRCATVEITLDSRLLGFGRFPLQFSVNLIPLHWIAALGYPENLSALQDGNTGATC